MRKKDREAQRAIAAQHKQLADFHSAYTELLALLDQTYKCHVTGQIDAQECSRVTAAAQTMHTELQQAGADSTQAINVRHQANAERYRLLELSW